MQALKTLIDRASEMCGGDAALARELKCSRSLVCLMKKGERTVTPEIAIILADMLNEDVDLALRQAHIAAAANSKNGSRIAEILGKGLTAGAVAMLATSYSGAANATSEIEDSGRTALDNIYIVSIRMLRKLRKVGAFSQAKTGLLQQWLLSHLAPRPL